MSTFPPRPAILAVALVAIGAIVPAAARDEASATDSASVNQAIADQERLAVDLARQWDQLMGLRRQEADLGAQIAGLQVDLDGVGVELGDATRRLAEVTEELEAERAALGRIREQIATLELDLIETAEEIDESEVDLAEREALLQEHLRVAYEQSRVSLLEVILSADTFDQAASELGYLMSVSDEDRLLAGEIKERRAVLQIRRQTLEEGRVTLGQLEVQAVEREAMLAQRQVEVDAARVRLEGLQAQLRDYLVAQEQALLATTANKEAQEELIAAQERSLAGQRQLVEQLKAEAERLDVAYRGRFAWPARGDFLVTQEFGVTTFNEDHTGIDTAYDTPACGGPIFAVASGTVLADGRPNTDHGDTAVGVIIGHSQALQSWYWHLSAEVVSVGQRVEAGELIGYEGSTGLATGCHLHLQVMLNGEPVDPRLYLP